METNKIGEITLIIILFVVLVCNAYFGYEYFSAEKNAASLSEMFWANTKIMSFQKVFVDKVLKTQGEVSYKDRLDLESAAVNTNNQDIVEAWHNFLSSETEEEAQLRVLYLLSLFSSRDIGI